MTEYQPSDSFVERVMRDVKNIHETEKKRQQRVEKLLGMLPTRLLLTGGATLLGIWNIVRVYLVLFAPVLCK